MILIYLNTFVPIMAQKFRNIKFRLSYKQLAATILMLRMVLSNIHEIILSFLLYSHLSFQSFSLCIEKRLLWILDNYD